VVTAGAGDGYQGLDVENYYLTAKHSGVDFAHSLETVLPQEFCILQSDCIGPWF